jgi:hypothetical protein
MADEWLYARAFTNRHDHHAEALPILIHGYNHHRGHTAPAGQPPTHPRQQPARTAQLDAEEGTQVAGWWGAVGEHGVVPSLGSCAERAGGGEGGHLGVADEIGRELG